MTNVNIIVNNLDEYKQGTENLKKAGFQLKDQTVNWDLWETKNTRYWVRKDW